MRSAHLTRVDGNGVGQGNSKDFRRSAGRAPSNNQHYTMENAGLAAGAVFFSQRPSFLDYRCGCRKRARTNTSSLLEVECILSAPFRRGKRARAAVRQVPHLKQGRRFTGMVSVGTVSPLSSTLTALRNACSIVLASLSRLLGAPRMAKRRSARLRSASPHKNSSMRATS